MIDVVGHPPRRGMFLNNQMFAIKLTIIIFQVDNQQLTLTMDEPALIVHQNLDSKWKSLDNSRYRKRFKHFIFIFVSEVFVYRILLILSSTQYRA